MFYVKDGDYESRHRTIIDAARTIVDRGDTSNIPIWRKTKTRPAPFDVEIAAFVREFDDGAPYVIRIDRNGYDMIGTKTPL